MTPAPEFVLTYPGTDQLLTEVGGQLLSDTSIAFERLDHGIWDLTRAEDRERFDRFASTYSAVRSAEQRTMTADVVRALPYPPPSDPLAQVWAQRAESFERLLAVLTPMTPMTPITPISPIAQMVPMTLVDVGAGCGWLAARLADHGWRSAAIDVTVDGGDGLASARHHHQELFLARADMAALPFGSASVGAIVFNASLHYADSIEAALSEAARVVADNGVIAVVDSPTYTDAQAGAAMVAEFAADVTRRHGIAAAPIAGPGFVVDDQLAGFARQVGASWIDAQPDTGVGARLHRWRGARKAGREIARRPTLTMTRPARRTIRPDMGDPAR